MQKKEILRYAFKKSVPVMLGYIFLGTAFGILLRKAGYAWPWALLMSGLVYAGSMEFAMVPLLAEMTPLTTVAIMTLMVNSRHLFYGISYVDLYRTMKARYPYMIFSLTDETYSVLSACREDEPMQACGHIGVFYLSALHQSYWVLGSVLGGIAGELLTRVDTTGIDFCMTALFVVILVEQILNGRRDTRVSAVMAMAVAVLLLLALGAANFLLPTLMVTVALLALTNGRIGGEANV